jgi:hypothetical protein
MTLRADLEEFVMEHKPHGTLTADVRALDLLRARRLEISQLCGAAELTAPSGNDCK